ncbi:hypothetical protein DFR60_114137 [Hungatella effluvii]|uniref:Uncharacterized protein n=1 Tax=Hungatella effluvii TaxID=1096246 RepID=A0A2V3XXP4_9FIRM|nr:hypothetical protein [Hungatella effluvii]PXX49345.1 hypothetical protein DFR60_114137 [Hungatella effluvii]
MADPLVLEVLVFYIYEIVLFLLFSGAASTQPKFLWEGEGEAGKRAGFLFRGSQELKPEGRKKGW